MTQETPKRNTLIEQFEENSRNMRRERRRKIRALVLVLACLPAGIAYICWCERHPVGAKKQSRAERELEILEFIESERARHKAERARNQ